MIYYKIRSKKDPELFLAGTPKYNRFCSYGRIFQTRGLLRAFLTRSLDSPSAAMSDWEIVKLELVIREVNSVNEIIDPKLLIKLLSR
jgi:hypothetical protein